MNKDFGKENFGGIYIHIPFCVKKCNYCGFVSEGAEIEKMEEYVDSLCIEMKNINSDIECDSIYIGGGTPSLLKIDAIEKILNTARQNFNLQNEAEITMEVNPDSVAKEKLKAYRDLGINRISMGAQSFNDNRLRFLGRVHNKNQILHAYDNIRDAYFKNINIDLMFGLPDETLQDVINDINELVKLMPDHISLYSLELERGTKIYEEVKNGKIKLISYNLDREMYHNASKLLNDAGFEKYEISNFAREGKYSRHNMKYWQMKPYFGFGASAASFVDNIRYKNISDVSEYVSKIRKTGNAISENHKNTKFDNISESIFTGLRKSDGIKFDTMPCTKKEFFKTYSSILKDLYEYEQAGKIKISDEGIKLTEDGIDISNKIMALFV